MTDHVHWVIEVDVKPGKVEAFKSLVAEMTAATKNEPGTLAYEFNLSADGALCHVYERYKDSAAVLTHLGNFGKNFAKRFFDLVTPGKFFVYGNPSEDARKGLAGLNPSYFKLVSGFFR